MSGNQKSVINENYVNFSVVNINGIQVQDTFVRSDVEWVWHEFDGVVMVR